MHPQPLSPSDLSSEGQTAYQAGKFLEAAAAFEQAARAYRASGDEAAAAEAANNSSVAYLQAGDAQKAFEMAENTHLVFASKGDLTRQGMALANQAAALEGLKRFKEALELYRQSSEAFKSSGDHELRADQRVRRRRDPDCAAGRKLRHDHGQGGRRWKRRTRWLGFGRRSAGQGRRR
uniref:Tetratricopeptide repeat protein n=1 Tax=Anaerolinea thermolimosa TaxID=229919 RepID=A0A7C4KJ26_9CHLR